MRRIVLVVFVVLLTVSIFTQGILVLPKEEKEKLAFPYDIAGFGAWIKLDKAPNFKTVGSFFEQLVAVSDNHILGWTTKETGRGVRAYLYADTNGYLVVFLHKDTPPSDIIDFSQVDFVKREVRSFTILRLMESVLKALGYDYRTLLPKINFADFQYPEANSFFIAFTTSFDTYSCYLHFAVSSQAYVYSISVINLFRGRGEASNYAALNLDSQELESWYKPSSVFYHSQYIYRIVDGKSTGTDPTKPHTVSLWNAMGDLAIVVIYKK